MAIMFSYKMSKVCSKHLLRTSVNYQSYISICWTYPSYSVFFMTIYFFSRTVKYTPGYLKFKLYFLMFEHLHMHWKVWLELNYKNAHRRSPVVQFFTIHIEETFAHNFLLVHFQTIVLFFFWIYIKFPLKWVVTWLSTPM